MELDFLNLNTLRTFPIKEGKSAGSTDRVFFLPDDFIVDATFAVDSDVNTRLYISKISNLPTEIVIEISKHTGDLVGTFNITTQHHTLYKEYYMTPSTTFAKANGRITIAYLTRISKQPTGAFFFNISSTEFEARCVIPSVAGVSRLVFKDDNEAEFSVTGNIVIQARSNMKFSLDNGVVYLDAGNGLGLNTNTPAVVPAIKTINGIGPDADGNFQINLLDCENLTPTTNGLVLTDSCNKPCMGCNEIGELTDRLIQLESDLLTLRQHFNDIDVITQQLNNIVNYNCELS